MCTPYLKIYVVNVSYILKSFDSITKNIGIIYSYFRLLYRPIVSYLWFSTNQISKTCINLAFMQYKACSWVLPFLYISTSIVTYIWCFVYVWLLFKFMILILGKALSIIFWQTTLYNTPLTARIYSSKTGSYLHDVCKISYNIQRRENYMRKWLLTV